MLWNDLQSELYLLLKRIQSGSSLLILSGFNEKKKSSSVFTKSKMDFFDYQYIVGNNFVPLKSELTDQNLLFLHDNFSIRKSMSTSD